MFEVYRNKRAVAERMATLSGAGLPEHADPKDWEMLASENPQVTEDGASDIAARGFSYFKLVTGPRVAR